mgnify:CR=1 FL=1
MKINYRPEIDGLRAIAVSSVILYHAKISIYGKTLFEGGFVGVDIFFVISGYLITLILLKDLKKYGSISFKKFYDRRIKRILPALFVVMVSILPFAWLYLLPLNLVDFSKSSLSSLGFFSNLYFYFSGQEYGANSGLLKPLLHTWSLSIEEQFYLLFPIFLVISYKYFRKKILLILIFVFLISLCLSLLGNKFNPVLNYYIISSRIWELLSGSLIAYLHSNNKIKEPPKSLSLILPSIGFLFILDYIFFFQDELSHPSIHTLKPIIGTCLILYFSNKNEIISKLLSLKLFVGIGLISYSLYLWHYPIFAFARITRFAEDSLFKELLVGFIILIFSIITYFFVEVPARNRKTQSKLIYLILITLFFTILSFNFFAISSNGFKSRNHFPEILINSLKNLNYRNIKQNKIECHHRSGKNGFCIFNQRKDNIGDIILLGDSLTDALLSDLIDKVSKTKFRLIHMSYSGNLYLPEFIEYEKETKKFLINEDFHEYRKDFLENKTNKNTYVVIYGNYNLYFEKGLKFDENKNIIEYETANLYSKRENINLSYEKRINLLKNKFKNTLIELSKSKKVILIYPTPISPESVLERIKTLGHKKKFKDKNFYLSDQLNYEKSIYKKFYFEVINFFNKLDVNNIYKIELEDIFCPKTKCIFYDDKHAYIFDITHPSKKGSDIINNLIMEKISNLELQN